MVLRIWAVLSTSANGVARDLSQQPVQKVGEIKALISLLAQFLRTFQVPILLPLDNLMRLTTATSSATVTMLMIDYTLSVRYLASVLVITSG